MFQAWPLNLFSEMLLTGATEQPVFGKTGSSGTIFSLILPRQTSENPRKISS
jgi:hypothetical protein